MEDSDFIWLQTFLYDTSANVLDRGKEYLAEVRLMPLAKREGFDSIHHMMEAMRTRSMNGLHQKVIEAMTTNETSFFRDGHPFEALKKQVLPEIIRKRAQTKTLNLWCAAASSGQEPYSILMVIHENFPELANWTINFFASDISGYMLKRCSEGVYSQLEVSRGLPAELLAKYFVKADANWRIRDDLRSRVKFLEVNLAKAWPLLPVMDIIFIRNVMIYFDLETKRRILSKLEGLIRPDGYLFLGGAETTLNLNEAFERVQIERAGCYRLKSPGAPQL